MLIIAAFISMVFLYRLISRALERTVYGRFPNATDLRFAQPNSRSNRTAASFAF